MKYINLPTTVFRSVEFIMAEAEEVAIWLELMSYCAECENGGVIEGARKWSDRLWQRFCGHTADDVQACQSLLSWDGDNLVLKFYPHEQEASCQKMREGGRKGGKNTPSREVTSPPSSPPSREASNGDSIPPGDNNNNKDKDNNKEREITTSVDTPSSDEPAEETLSHSAKKSISPLRHTAEEIKRLRPSWALNYFSSEEKQALSGILNALPEGHVPDETLEDIAQYFAEEPKAGGDKWDYPKERLLFLQNFFSIAQKASGYAKRARDRTRKKAEPLKATPPAVSEAEHLKAVQAIKELRESFLTGETHHD